MNESVKTKYNYWLNKVSNKALSDEMHAMTEEQIVNAFYKDLEFGTGGMRGTMGAGTNCLNIYTIARATQGLANYMKAHNLHSAAITYDTRINSRLFSRHAAAVLATNGIKVHITDDCMPTPFLSYAIRTLHADAGINVTASHNPKEYNGYKVYDNTGCQVLDEVANEITAQIEAIDPFDVAPRGYDELVAEGLICPVTDELIASYQDTVIGESLGEADGITVVYTPLNGAGYATVPTVLKRVGVSDLHIVKEQALPNGNFTTCPYPNPEKIAALQLALQLAEQTHADVVVANDPDCDRLGVAVAKENGYDAITGNEVAILFADYILSTLRAQNRLPINPKIVTTIVSTPMVKAIAADYNAKVYEVLTGFKYIGDIINKLYKKGEESDFVFGFEESCGYLKGTYARDKDGVVASMLVCEMTAHYKKQGLSLYQRLQQLYAQYGNYEQRLLSYRFDGADGAVRKEQLLADIRKTPLAKLADSNVTSVVDLLQPSDLPKADVIIFHADDGSKLVIRPSGTEPLIKCYLMVHGTTADNKARLDKMQAQLDELLK